MRIPPRPLTYRGRIYDPESRTWYFADGSGTRISEEVRENELEGLLTLQEDNTETAKRLFDPKRDWKERRG